MASLSSGQYQARTRWNTHKSGAAFDRKKLPHLTEHAQAFITHQAWCALAGVGPEHDLCGLLVMNDPGFVQIVDQQTCLFPVTSALNSHLIRGLLRAEARGNPSSMAACFMSHVSRERLCLQGIATISSGPHPVSMTASDKIWIRLHIEQAFFHCPKYIRTTIDGLNASSRLSVTSAEDLYHQYKISASVQGFLEQGILCFLCTMNRTGCCTINHRGGGAGFLVARPAGLFSRGEVLLPDYAGNGAFEAIGNILEIGRAALIIPDYSAQMALCISGKARVVEMSSLSSALQKRCKGAQRVIRITPQRIEAQTGDWDAALAYERQRTSFYRLHGEFMETCPT